jgi:hypothetical protein
VTRRILDLSKLSLRTFKKIKGDRG